MGWGWILEGVRGGADGWFFGGVWAGAGVQLAAEAEFCLGARRDPDSSSEVIIFFLTTRAHTPRKGSDPLQQEHSQDRRRQGFMGSRGAVRTVGANRQRCRRQQKETRGERRKIPASHLKVLYLLPPLPPWQDSQPDC